MPKTPRTPRARNTPKKPVRAALRELPVLEQSPLLRAERALNQSLPQTLLCRDKEVAFLESFLSTCLETTSPASLYVWGPPGTGKTSCLSQVLSRRKEAKVVINCTSVNTPQAIYGRIGEELLPKRGGKPQGSLHIRDELEAHLTSTDSMTDSMVIIVLDEIEQLESKVRYSLFQWPQLQNSKVILIGVANVWTECLLPRLQVNHLNFPPYSREQIITILTSRLQREGVESVFNPQAIQFCARKVSAIRGDLRNALDICRRALGIVGNTGTVTVRDIAQVTCSVSATQSLTLHEKLVACTLLCVVRTNRRPALGKLYGAYIKICQQRHLQHESEAEFVGVVDLLEARGVLTIKKKGKGPPLLATITLRLNEVELTETLQDKVLMTTILEQGLPP